MARCVSELWLPEDPSKRRFHNFLPILKVFAVTPANTTKELDLPLELVTPVSSEVPETRPVLPPVPQPTRTPAPPVNETPAQKKQRWLREATEKLEQARNCVKQYDYATAVRILESFAAGQMPHRDERLLDEARAKRDRLAELTKNIRTLLDKELLHDSRLSVWVPQYLELFPIDQDMQEFARDLPPPNEWPKDPQPGQRFVLKVPLPIPEREPGERWNLKVMIPDPKTQPGTLWNLKVVIPDPKTQPGTIETLRWRAVGKRANPNAK